MRVDESVGGRMMRVIDGQRAWGSIDTGVSRQGFRRYRLVVFPPEISDSPAQHEALWWQAYDRLGRNEHVRGTTVDRKVH
jgi:hypothetical protein